jgi:hypothetical protein
VVLMGVVLLVVGLITTQAALMAGVVGFLVMICGAALFIRRPRR